MKTIVVFDPFTEGHHLTYLRLFSQVLLEMGQRVIVFCSQPDDLLTWLEQRHPKYISKLSIFEVKSLKIPPFPGLGYVPRPIDRLLQWRHASLTIQRTIKAIDISVDLVFFPWLDAHLSEYLFPFLVDRIFPYSWSGLFFHPPYLLTGKQKHLPILNWPLTPYSLTGSIRCTSIALIDEFEAEKLQDTLDKPIITFPDLTDDALPDWDYSILKTIREKAGKRKIVGLLGSLTFRKGILTLLEVAAQMQQDNWFFVFAGKLIRDSFSIEDLAKIDAMVSTAPDNCFFHFDWIPGEAQFNALVTICDVLFAAYLSFPYSSNLLAKAAMFEKPIIVSEGACMSKRVEQYQLGVSIPEGDVKQCILTLHELTLQLNGVNNLGQPDFQGYLRFHSMEQLRAALHEVCSHIS